MYDNAVPYYKHSLSGAIGKINLENRTISDRVLLGGFPIVRPNLNWTDIWANFLLYQYHILT